MVCFLAAGSSSSIGAEGDAHLWELRFWETAEGMAASASAFLFPTSPALGKLSLKLFSWSPPHNIKRDEDGKHRNGWLGSKAGFPFSVLEAASVEGCGAWLLMPFGSERLGTSVWTTGKTAWGKGLTQNSESPGTERRERGEVMLGLLADFNIVSVAQASFLKKKVMKRGKTFSPKLPPYFILESK